MTDCLGVDVGGVIIDRVNGVTDTSFFSDNDLQTTAVPGVFEALAQLRDRRFGDQIHLVSKCGPRVEEKTRRWLAHRDFAGRTGIAPERWHFCRTREGKAPLCAALGVTHFVDDRLEVLGYLGGVPHCFLFRPEPGELQRHRRHLPAVGIAESWPAMTALVLAAGAGV